MLAVIVPAHIEASYIESCINSVIEAARHPGLRSEPVSIFVVLDHCTDDTRAIAATMGVHVREIEDRNVGIARATGAAAGLSFGARWLAFTDADTVVAHDWLVQQLQCGTDAVCGTVGIQDWAGHPTRVINDFVENYHDIDGHRHIHGANLGLSAKAFMNVGGSLANSMKTSPLSTR
jgi:glycosyltransferase involved in cell wall biosynthesis